MRLIDILILFKLKNVMSQLSKILFVVFMNIDQTIRDIWYPVTKHTSKISFRKITKKLSISIWFSLLFLIKFIYYTIAKPEKLTLSMSKTAEKASEMKIPKLMRKKFFKLYSKYYKVKLDEIVDPLDSFETFSAFFTRKIKPRQINTNPFNINSPADSKILKISQISEDQCSIIKGASYSLGELLTGEKKKFNRQQIKNLKINPRNKLFQIIFYLAPGDYHRFHCPTDYYVAERKKIDGILLSVSEKTLIKKKKVYEKNGRLVLNGTWKADQNEMFMSMVMVGALNVGRIIVQENESFNRGEQLGYFNLGSTIVIIFEAENAEEWYKNEGDSVRYGEPVCRIASK